jgi:hypothetical protein
VKGQLLTVIDNRLLPQAPARKLVNIPPAAIGGERCWSDFATIWTSKRARLLVGRVAMLAYIYYNSRVLAGEGPSGAEECSWEGCLECLEGMPELCFGENGLAVEPEQPEEELS